MQRATSSRTDSAMHAAMTKTATVTMVMTRMPANTKRADARRVRASAVHRNEVDDVELGRRSVLLATAFAASTTLGGAQHGARSGWMSAQRRRSSRCRALPATP